MGSPDGYQGHGCYQDSVGGGTCRPQACPRYGEGIIDRRPNDAGGQSVHAAPAEPERKPASSVILIHEWWRLNDQIKAVADDLAKQGYRALAVDLFDGKVTSDPSDASSYMNSVDPRRATDVLAGWIDWPRSREGGRG